LRFTSTKWVLFAIKGFLFPLWLNIPFLSCPLYAITHGIVNTGVLAIPDLSFLHGVFTCAWMSISLMDFVLALTLGFVSNDKFSFWLRPVVEK